MAQSIVDLAAAITRGADTLNALYKQNNLENPSHFAEPAPLESTEPFTKAKNDILDAAVELYDLLLAPSQLLRLYSGMANNIVLQFIYRFNIAQLAPPTGTISADEIAKQCKQPKRDVVRLMRHATALRLFDEAEDGMFRHTRFSLLLRTEPFHNRVGCTVEDYWTASTKMVDAMTQFPGSEASNESAYALSQPDRISFYDHMAADQALSDRFTKGRKAYSVDHKPEIAQLLSVCNGVEALHAGATVVDIGGASGWVSMELSAQFPKTRFIVEDLASVIATRENAIKTNGDVKPVDPAKIEFLAHDFFQPQPVHGAAVYYMRWILHNHSDTAAVQILQKLVPAMTDGCRVLIHDYVLDGFAELQHRSMVDRRMTSAMDIGMQMLFNARERTAEDWKSLLTRADSRFKMVGIDQAEDSSLALIEVVWG